MKGRNHIYIYVCVHSPPNSPPIQATTSHAAESPVLHIGSLLVIHFKYSSVYMSIPNSLWALINWFPSLEDKEAISTYNPPFRPGLLWGWEWWRGGGGHTGSRRRPRGVMRVVAKVAVSEQYRGLGWGQEGTEKWVQVTRWLTLGKLS